ncbi:MAG: TIGR03960 family B12-binding radical SAM protein [Nitrospirota bacterium]
MNLSFLQKPSRYINNEINAVYSDKPVKVALVFPDIYEIGMSHLGLKILYMIINDLPFASAERVFSPWVDLEAEIKAKGILLSSLESRRPLRDFDIVGFSLQYELSYTTVLNMLSMGGIPVTSEERLSSPSFRYPLVIAGGPCSVNPMPMSPFIDAFLIGDGEEAVKEILETYYRWKNDGDGKKESLLQSLSQIEGIYVPSIHASSPKVQFVVNDPSSFILHPSSSVKRRILSSLDNAPYPDKPIVPFTAIVHDRINIEVSRGCSMGCRFCQAGMIYRPVRERSPHNALALAETALRNTGYEEVAFTSLSAGDYSCLLNVVRDFNKKFKKDRIALSLPSLRVAAINTALLKEIRTVRKTGFTIAPEAGTERLRKVINKDFSDGDYEQSLKILFEEGWLNLKLYFMIGLPTETDEDIEGILTMALKALKTAKQYTKRFVNINIGVSPFIPKAHTPFQWYGQHPSDALQEKKNYIKDKLVRKGFKVKGHDIKMSLLEAAFSRSDARIAPFIEKAWSLGCRLDGWTEVFDFRKWEQAMRLTGTDVTALAQKSFSFADSLPWDTIDVGISKEFLWRENQKALSGDISTDCRKTCHNCGLDCNKSIDSRQSTVGRQTQTADEFSPVILHAKPFNPVRIRVEFSKTSGLRHLSHLELITLFHRAMRRAGFPLEFSKGFHPAPKISFGPPLGVGVAGMREYLDMEITPPFDLVMNKKKLNEMLPDAISVNDMSVIPAGDPSLNAFIYRYEYEINDVDISPVHRFLSKKELLVAREKGTINIRNMVEEVTMLDEDSVSLLVMDQGDSKVRLGELIPLLFDKSLEELDITRVALYGWNGGWVKPIERSLQWTAKY